MEKRAQTQTERVTLAVTGASGSILAVEMLRLLTGDARVRHVDLVVSDAALRVLAEELGVAGRSTVVQRLTGNGQQAEKVKHYAEQDVGASIASGSYPTDAMVVLPCSMGTLAGIAHGMASSLIERAADVCLKERRPLVLCVRETPFNLVHLRNMNAAAESGATIYPVMPTFYNKPQDIGDLVTNYVQRVLGFIGLRQSGAYEWGSD